jgi:hypothetical protein
MPNSSYPFTKSTAPETGEIPSRPKDYSVSSQLHKCKQERHQVKQQARRMYMHSTDQRKEKLKDFLIPDPYMVPAGNKE